MVEDEVRSDRSSERELNKRFGKTIDNFEKLLVRNTTSDADLGAHYPVSPERYRLSVNGTQKYLAYGVPTELTDSVDSYDVNPAGGDTNTFKTAERWRYAVGYTLAVSWAEQVNQSLTGDDVVVRGLGDTDQYNAAAGEPLGPAADGWFVVSSADLADDVIRFVIVRDGTIKSDELVRTNRPITSHRRFDITFDWYNVGSAVLTETYVEDGEQINEDLEEIGVDDDVAGTDKGPKTGNKQLEWSVSADSNNTGLTYQIGSAGVITNGDIIPIKRNKTARLDVTYGAGNDDYLPIAAIRENDPDEVINTQLSNLSISNKSDNTADLEVLAIAVNNDNTDASGFETPAEHNQFNSVIEETTTVTTQPDPSQSNADTVVTTSNALANPGGWQVGYASSYSSGQGTNTERSSTSVINPRNFYPDDVVLLLARSNVDNLNFTMEYTTEQQW